MNRGADGRTVAKLIFSVIVNDWTTASGCTMSTENQNEIFVWPIEEVEVGDRSCCQDRLSIFQRRDWDVFETDRPPPR